MPSSSSIIAVVTYNAHCSRFWPILLLLVLLSIFPTFSALKCGSYMFGYDAQIVWPIEDDALVAGEMDCQSGVNRCITHRLSNSNGYVVIGMCDFAIESICKGLTECVTNAVLQGCCCNEDVCNRWDDNLQSFFRALDHITTPSPNIKTTSEGGGSSSQTGVNGRTKTTTPYDDETDDTTSDNSERPRQTTNSTLTTTITVEEHGWKWYIISAGGIVLLCVVLFCAYFVLCKHDDGGAKDGDVESDTNDDRSATTMDQSVIQSTNEETKMNENTMTTSFDQDGINEYVSIV